MPLQDTWDLADHGHANFFVLKGYLMIAPVDLKSQKCQLYHAPTCAAVSHVAALPFVITSNYPTVVDPVHYTWVN